MKTSLLIITTLISLPLIPDGLAQTEGFEATCTVKQGVPSGSIVERVRGLKEGLVKKAGRYDPLGSMGRGEQTYHYEKGVQPALISKVAFVAGLTDTAEGRKWQGILYPVSEMYEYTDVTGATHRIEQFSTIPLTATNPPTAHATIIPLVPGNPSLGFLTIMQSVSITLQGNKTVILPVGTRLEFVSQEGSEAHIRYQGGDYAIPISATDLNYSAESGTQETPELAAPQPQNNIQATPQQNLFDGTWVGTINTRFGPVKFTLSISGNGTVESDTSKRGPGGPRDATNDGKTMTWYWGVDNKTVETFTPNPDGKTAVMTGTGPAIRGMSAFNASAIFHRTSP